MASTSIHEQRRREITEAAIRVIARNGWARASIAKITREANCSRGLPSYHFKNKAELLSAVLARCREIYDETLQTALAGSDDEYEQMRISIRTALRLVHDNPAAYLVFLHFAADARTHPELGDELRAMYADFRERLAQAVSHGQHVGIYRRDLDPMAAAGLITSALTGVGLHALVDPDGFPFAGAATLVEAFLINSLTVEASPFAPRALLADVAVYA